MLSLFIIGLKTAVKAQDQGTFSDPRDGNVYKWIRLGEQIWMAENLRAAHFRNGDQILVPLSKREWKRESRNATPMVQDYNHDAEISLKYGKLYNYQAVSDARGLCPYGWRVANDADWANLELFLGAEKESILQLGRREPDIAPLIMAVSENPDNSYIIQMWNSLAMNVTGFSALPAGYVYNYKFEGLGTTTSWWTTEQYLHYTGIVITRHIYILPSMQGLYRNRSFSSTLRSVRCVIE